MTIGSDVKEIKSLILEVNRKLNCLLKQESTSALAVMENNCLEDFLEREPDMYSLKDIKVKYDRTKR